MSTAPSCTYYHAPIRSLRKRRAAIRRYHLAVIKAFHSFFSRNKTWGFGHRCGGANWNKVCDGPGACAPQVVKDYSPSSGMIRKVETGFRRKIMLKQKVDQ
jgi:hypothetical protein